MLVISRKVREALVIATIHGPITVTVVNVRGRQVKLSVDAPRAVTVLREELLQPVPKEE